MPPPPETITEVMVPETYVNPGGPIRRPKPPGPKPLTPTHVEGLRVILSPVHGLTPKGYFDKYSPWRFQCPPMDVFTITHGHDSQEYETVYDGTFSVHAAAKLDIIQFKTLLVEDDYPFVVDKHVDVHWARELLKNLSQRGVPFRLNCTHHKGLRSEYNGICTLTDYIHTENEPFTYYTDVTFKQYRDPTSSIQKPRRPHRTWPKHHKLTAGDTLYKLAKHYYGKPSLARMIAKANHIRTADFNRPIVQLGGKWKVGVSITIPKPPPAKPKKHKPKKTQDV